MNTSIQEIASAAAMILWGVSLASAELRKWRLTPQARKTDAAMDEVPISRGKILLDAFLSLLACGGLSYFMLGPFRNAPPTVGAVAMLVLAGSLMSASSRR